jgi:translation initiation factor IF-2
MSIRIHTIAKEIGMENKELLAILRERGFDVKSASNTIDNISGDSIIEEFKAIKKMEEQEAPKEEKVKKGPTLPAGAIVKSRTEIEKEREELKKQEEEKKAEAEKSVAKVEPEPAPVKKETAAPAIGKAPSLPPMPSGSAPKAPPMPGMGGTAPKTPPMPGMGGSAPKTPPMPMAMPGIKAPAPVVVPSPVAAKAAADAKPVDAATNKPGSVVMPGSEVKKVDDNKGDEKQGGEAESVKEIKVKTPIVVREFAALIGLKPFHLISQLMEMGIFASMNQTLEEDVAMDVALKHGYLLEIQKRGESGGKQQKKKAVEEDDSANLEPRSAIVCILGHVDHGKTTLLDAIRKTNVVSGEAGGITQHVAAYQIKYKNNPITFIDTPGHAAFSAMRERGANLTDISVLVVAADDGFMPQTDEALKFAKRSQGSIVVAINKCDAKGANVDRVKTQMQERGIAPEDWGGETLTQTISALKGDGIEDLLEQINLQSEIMELKANPKGPAKGVIIESQIEQGRGPTTSVIIQKGTLKMGDGIVCGTASCKVKAMLDDAGKNLKEAGPSTPLKIIGWSEAPDVGSTFEVVKNEKEAKMIAAQNLEAKKKEQQELMELAKQSAAETASTGVDALFEAISQAKKKVLKIIIRGDVQGSVEALITSLRGIKSDKVDLDIVQAGIGLISKSDISMASAAGASLIGFNVRLENGVQGLAKHHNINIYQHNIIYELIDIVKDAMADLLDPDISEKKIGAAEVRAVFSIGKSTQVAGCMVTEGKINRDIKARIVRNGTIIHSSTVDTLKRFKDDVNEVRAGYECGIRINGYNDYEEGDLIEVIQIEKKRASL